MLHTNGVRPIYGTLSIANERSSIQEHSPAYCQKNTSHPVRLVVTCAALVQAKSFKHMRIQRSAVIKGRHTHGYPKKKKKEKSLITVNRHSGLFKTSL